MTDLLELLSIISYIVGIVFLALLISELCISFVKGLKAMFEKIEKPKFKELHLPKRKQDNYPVEVYLNNAMRYLLEDPESNTRAISELRYAMIKGHYEIQPDVLLQLYNRLNLWQFPEED